MVFPPILGEKLAHAHASYPGLSLRAPGFSPNKTRAEERVQAGTGLAHHFVFVYKKVHVLCKDIHKALLLHSQHCGYSDLRKRKSCLLR